MKSNFEFLVDEWNKIYERAKKAEEFAFPDTRVSYIFARMALELAVKLIYEKDYDLDKKYKSTLDDYIKDVEFKRKLGVQLIGHIIDIKDDGNNAVHNDQLKFNDPKIILKKLFEFSKWFQKNYSELSKEINENFDEEILVKYKEIKKLSIEDLKELEEKLKSENQIEIDKFRHKIQELELVISNHIEKIQKQEAELFDLKKIISENDTITAKYNELQSQNKRNENYYSFQIQEVGLTEQKGIIWGRVFINFIYNNEQYFAVKYFSPLKNEEKIQENKIIQFGKYQESELYRIFDKYHSNLSFQDILNKDYDSIQLVDGYNSKRFGTPSLIFEKLFLDLKKQFAFKLGDKEYIKNGHYKIDNIEFMSIWAFKKYILKRSNEENITDENFSDANKLLANKTSFYKSKPDYGNFNEIKIYSVEKLKEFYSIN
jgi:hypothetical protein